MATKSAALTYDDLLEMPDEGRLRELIGGELIVSPAPSLVHQELVLRLVMLLHVFVQARQLGRVILAPFDVRLGPEVLQPDILYVSNDRSAIIRDNHTLGGPDLVVEVLSPSTRRRDQGVKQALYAAADVREYWQADSVGRTFRALALDGGRYRPIPQVGSVVPSAVLPGLKIDVVELFARLP
jgi:Uma2 family endonuclease